jgi:hypothetical protein
MLKAEEVPMLALGAVSNSVSRRSSVIVWRQPPRTTCAWMPKR